MRRRFHSRPTYSERHDVERHNVVRRQSVGNVSGLNGRISNRWTAVP
jgi:hypothetical protein